MEKEKITFGCNIFSNKKVLSCSFGLTKSELELLKTVIENKKGISVKEISSFLDKGRTTIQKTIKSLLDKKLIKRKQVNLKKGFAYIYYPLNKEDYIKIFDKKLKKIKNNIHKEINNWYS